MPEWLGSQMPFDRYMVEVGSGLRMHVMEVGEGRPVVLFHGNPTWGYLYRKVAAELSGEPFRLIMPDLVGLGFSDRASSVSEYTFENYSNWTSSLLTELQLDDVIGVGQDWGGPIGFHALSRNPGMMTAAVVMNTSLMPPKPGFKPTLFHRIFSTKLGDFASRYLGLPQRALGLAQNDRNSISGAVSKAYTYPLSRKRGNEAVAALVRMVPDNLDHPSVVQLTELREFIEAFDGPTAIVWGKNDPVLGRLMARHQRLLNDPLVIETDAGHFLQEEVPLEIASAIRSVSEADA
jgi:cis-3-alkyl-4-acyloxetan-2-one decarboxylase